MIDCVEETLIQEQGRREKNAYIGTCTDCGLEDSLPVSNSQELPDVGDIVEKYICDCGNIAWEVVGYDRLVFERESRFAQGPDISGTWHHYEQVEWRHEKRGEAHGLLRPECPVSQLGSAETNIGCSHLGERFTDEKGRGAWRCYWHGHFRVFDYPVDQESETEQVTLGGDRGAE